MNATRTIGERRLNRIQSPPEHSRFAISLPPPRSRRHADPSSFGREMWWGHAVHTEIHGALRVFAALLLTLLTVLAMIWLFAELWR
jgi:hypothetical protein